MVPAFVIEPLTYQPFEDEAALIEQCKRWGLLTEKATKTKTFLYKKQGASMTCSIVGLVDSITAVIEFEDQQRHCIHPSYLKEMQASGFTQRIAAEADELAEGKSAEPDEAEAVPAAKSKNRPQAEDGGPADQSEETAEKPKAKAKKEKAPKLELPVEKVGLTAIVKAFATVPNHFSDNDDEVIIYESVAITEPALELGEAWSSHSATLKKLELEVGDHLTFEGKLVAKKLSKHPVPYKINNPAKMQKSSPTA
ncbi:hypothetical protein WMW72_18970 [Paenibacillus filicis]|uniref:Uncharacterized protein n=1 Tax=Paenibacillus filicis TaxID=669464 RepID=A0ABU9DPK8_9BACL